MAKDLFISASAYKSINPSYVGTSDVGVFATVLPNDGTEATLRAFALVKNSFKVTQPCYISIARELPTLVNHVDAKSQTVDFVELFSKSQRLNDDLYNGRLSDPKAEINALRAAVATEMKKTNLLPVEAEMLKVIDGTIPVVVEDEPPVWVYEYYNLAGAIMKTRDIIVDTWDDITDWWDGVWGDGEGDGDGGGRTIEDPNIFTTAINDVKASL